MSDSEQQSLTVFVGDGHVAAHAILKALRRTQGSFLCVLSPDGLSHIESEPLRALLVECRALNNDRMLIMATKEKKVLQYAKEERWRVISTMKDLKDLLKKHPSEAEAVRTFSPVVWRESIRSRLQEVGILSLPRVRIWSLLVASGMVFLYTVLHLLPSSEITIIPNQESRNFTTNVYFSMSGARLPVSLDHVRHLPLRLLTVSVERSLTFDQISKNFTGTNASMTVSVINDTPDKFSLKKGSRLVNQSSGMIFRIQESVILEPRSQSSVRAIADSVDQYGDVLGSRGNIPAGVKWDFLKLPEDQRKLVYARNVTAGTGGTTSYVNVLTKEDIEGSKQRAGARQTLMQELRNSAKEQVAEEIVSLNAASGTHFVLFDREELTISHFRDFDLSESFIGQNVQSIPLRGYIDYTVVLYDENALLAMIVDEIMKRVPLGKTIVENSLSKSNMDVNLIAPWDDDLTWVKATVDLQYVERFILDPLTPAGATFAKQIRDTIEGKEKSEAYRIIKNLPEVSQADINLWPPWSTTLPDLGSSIGISIKDD